MERTCIRSKIALIVLVSILACSMLGCVAPENSDLVWEKNLGGSGDDTFMDVVATADGGFAALLLTDSKAEDLALDPGAFEVDTEGLRAVLVNYDRNGEAIWYYELDEADMDVAVALDACKDSGFVVVGNCMANANDPLAPERVLQNTDTVIAKIDAGGTLAWSTVVADEHSSRFMDVTQTIDGGFLAVGCFDIEHEQGSLLPNVYDDQLTDMLKFDASGTLLWQKPLLSDADVAAISGEQTSEAPVAGDDGADAAQDEADTEQDGTAQGATVQDGDEETKPILTVISFSFAKNETSYGVTAYDTLLLSVKMEVSKKSVKNLLVCYEDGEFAWAKFTEITGWVYDFNENDTDEILLANYGRLIEYGPRGYLEGEWSIVERYVEPYLVSKGQDDEFILFSNAKNSERSQGWGLNAQQNRNTYILGYSYLGSVLFELHYSAPNSRQEFKAAAQLTDGSWVAVGNQNDGLAEGHNALMIRIPGMSPS